MPNAQWDGWNVYPPNIGIAVAILSPDGTEPDIQLGGVIYPPPNCNICKNTKLQYER